ncbi:hypothetical protein ACFV1L_18345 [Kitasatospora sp. NPDC059646]|uniref:hypothetical protein n=1 Tax=Kitasatospora sp. NPDC059646 TaxID=3346893 RepID=UPI0036A9C28A
MKDSTRRLLRTIFAVLAGGAAAMPLLVHTAGIPDTVPGLSVLLGVSGAVTRLLALPVVEGWLPAWLRKAPDPDAEALSRAVRE